MKFTYHFNDFLKADFNFEKAAIELFHYQYNDNPVYAEFVNNLDIKPLSVKKLSDIPFLPVEIFKYREVKTVPEVAKVFTSSGTSGIRSSKHYVHDLSLYESSFITAFERFYGKVENYCVLALLPGYLERTGSSLVYMVNRFIEMSPYEQSGSYLYDHASLAEVLAGNEADETPTLLIGVTFGLLDFADEYQLDLKNTIVIETGGMKGRRKELTREEVHTILKHRLGVNSVHSEYGMTELLSQAYSKGDGLYQPPPWMKILAYDFYNPLQNQRTGKGGLKIIDLANIYSCAFVQTQDVGEVYDDGTFYVSGRFDHSDIRGCNLMVI